MTTIVSQHIFLSEQVKKQKPKTKINQSNKKQSKPTPPFQVCYMNRTARVNLSMCVESGFIKMSQNLWHR